MGWAEKVSPSCSSAGRHVLSIWLQTQGISAATSHVGRTQIFMQLHHREVWAETGNAKRRPLELCRHIHSHHGKHHVQPRTAAKRRHPSAPARCPPAQPAAAARCRPPLRRLPNMHPRPSAGTVWWDGVGFVCLFNRGQVAFLLLLKPLSSIPVQSKVNDDE